MRFHLIVITACLAMPARAQHKTDAETQGIHGQVATMTETTFTCPKHEHYGCILRSRPQPKYLTARTTHVIDGNGNEAECDHYNADGGLIAKYYFTYDANNFKTATVVRGSDGSLQNKMAYRYDAAGRPLATDFYNDKDSLYYTLNETAEFYDMKCAYEYDVQGKIQKESVYRTDTGSGAMVKADPNEPSRVFADTAAKSLLASRNNDGTRETIVKKSLTLEKDGSVLMEKMYRYEQFDKNGNWHQAIWWNVPTTDDRTEPVVYVINRNITYY